VVASSHEMIQVGCTVNRSAKLSNRHIDLKRACMIAAFRCGAFLLRYMIDNPIDLSFFAWTFLMSLAALCAVVSCFQSWLFASVASWCYCIVAFFERHLKRWSYLVFSLHISQVRRSIRISWSAPEISNRSIYGLFSRWKLGTLEKRCLRCICHLVPLSQTCLLNIRIICMLFHSTHLQLRLQMKIRCEVLLLVVLSHS